MRTFSRSGVSFRYPANWAFDLDEADDGGWTATAQSTGTALVIVSLRPEAEDPSRVADDTLDALRELYKELDAEDAVESLAGRPAVGHDIDFLTVDTAVSCRTRCVETPAGPLLVMGQVAEYDRAANEPVLRAVFASVAVEGD